MVGENVIDRLAREAEDFTEARRIERERVERKSRNEHEAMALIQHRDPCFKCGVRKDRHDEQGCNRWRPT